MAKKVDKISVEVDEVGLSVLGWEVVNPRARLITSAYDDTAFHEVAVSAELRFHPDDWEVRHSEDDADSYVPTVLCQLRSKRLGVLSPYSWLESVYHSSRLRRPKLVSNSSRTWEKWPAHDASDLYVWIGGFDWDDCDYEFEPAGTWRDLEYEFIDERTFKAFDARPTELSARISDDQLVVTARMTYSIGSAQDLLVAGHHYYEWSVPLNLAPEEQGGFAIPEPRTVFQVFDETGFLIRSSETAHDNSLRVRAGLRRPQRSPSAVKVLSANLDDLTGKPSRIVIRLQDEDVQ